MSNQEEKIQKILAPFIGIINDTPALLNFLYDVDMLPEQAVTVSDAISIATVVEAYKAGLSQRNTELEAAAEVIQWYLDNDETNTGDWPMPEHGDRSWNEINAYWIAGNDRAEEWLAAYRKAMGKRND